MDSWYAVVKYQDNETEIVPVRKIKNFRPEHPEDFDKNMRYIVKTKTYSLESKEEKYYAIIGRLGESPAALEAIPARVRWPNIVFNDEKPKTTTDEELHAENWIKFQRKQSGTVSSLKKKATEDAYQKFLHCHSLSSENSSEPSGTSKTDEENRELKERIKALEKQLEKSKQPLQSHHNPVENIENFLQSNFLNSLTNSLSNSLREFEKKMEERMEAALDRKVCTLETKIAEIDKKLINMDDYISKCKKSALSNFNYVQQWLNKSESNRTVE